MDDLTGVEVFPEVFDKAFTFGIFFAGVFADSVTPRGFAVPGFADFEEARDFVARFVFFLGSLTEAVLSRSSASAKLFWAAFVGVGLAGSALTLPLPGFSFLTADLMTTVFCRPLTTGVVTAVLAGEGLRFTISRSDEIESTIRRDAGGGEESEEDDSTPFRRDFEERLHSPRGRGGMMYSS